MRQRQWMKLLKDYDCRIEYHLSKANMVVDTLSKKTQSDNEALIDPELKKEMVTLQGMSVEMRCRDEGVFLATLRIRPCWVDRVVEAQK